MAFKKGKSGNSVGRPKGKQEDLARGWQLKICQQIVLQKGGVSEFSKWLLKNHPEKAIDFIGKTIPRETVVAGDSERPINHKVSLDDDLREHIERIRKG